MTETANQNMLGRELSPYLLQHSDNPVHWRAWNDAALAEAKTKSKPILLSIGYSACHWCHVMAHDCFENPDIAAVMNDLFVNIKVDREERPDIDAIYQHALALMGVQGGWPLTMFCTPNAKPFWGGTYFPAQSMAGRPGFADIVRKISDVHSEQTDQVTHNVGVIMEGLERISGGQAGPRLDDNDLKEMLTKLTAEFDPVNGGLAGAPKFPMIPMLKLALQAGELADDQQALRNNLIISADRIAAGGIYDHVGGGFARYSVDDRWLVPHFEKMLYDNAQFIDLYSQLWRDTNEPIYAARVADTIDWVVREMRHPDGGFFAALDADSEGVEGKFYVWSKSEVEQILGGRAADFAAAYDVTDNGNFEGANIPNRLRAEPAGHETEVKFTEDLKTLLQERAMRIRPRRDDKILTDWNGLMISGLTEAATAFSNSEWLDLSADAYRFVRAALTDDARLFHSWQEGKARFDGMLEDYANMIHAGIMLHEATGGAEYLDDAVKWTNYVVTHFAADGGGFHQSSDTASDVITRTRTCHDQPSPSGNGRMAENFVRLYFMTGQPDYRDAAQGVINFFAHEARGHPAGHATLVAAADLLERGVQIVIADPDVAIDGNDDAAALRTVAFTAPVRRRIIMPAAQGGHELPTDHPVYGKGSVDGGAAAYVCRGRTCSLPITDPKALRAELANN